jgi:hypothetical protein
VPSVQEEPPNGFNSLFSFLKAALINVMFRHPIWPDDEKSSQGEIVTGLRKELGSFYSALQNKQFQNASFDCVPQCL